MPGVIGRTRSSTSAGTPARHRPRIAGHPVAATTASARRNLRASVASRARSPARPAAMSTYCSGVSAISSGRPRFERMLTPAAAHRRATGQRDHRDAHPEGIQRGDAAVVGEGIEAQVQAVIAVGDTDSRAPGDELDAVAGDAAVLEQPEYAYPMTAVLGMDQQSRRRAGARRSVHHSSRAGRLTLAELIQAAERHEAVLRAPAIRRPAAVVRRLIAPEAVREPDRSLGVDRRRSRPAGRGSVGQAIVDRRQAGRARHGRACVTCTGAGLRAKTSRRLLAVCRARSTRMSIRSSRIRSATCSSLRPAVSCQRSARRPEPLGDGVGGPHVGVADDLGSAGDRDGRSSGRSDCPTG